MKRLLLLATLLLSPLFSLLSPSIVHADSTPPFAPFTVSGNPDEEYVFEFIFPLLKYIKPRYLKIFENRDRSREYNNYMLCPGGDERDYVCAVDNQTGDEVDGCDGGTVAICNRDSGEHVKDAYSNPNGSCTAKPDPSLPGTTKGKCSYKQRPSIDNTVKGTDFSGSDLIFPKLQNEANAYGYIGMPDNVITSGSHQNMFHNGDKILLQLSVVVRAKQTQDTLAKTGEWPLGWVDWGYKDDNMSRSLLEIYESIPSNLTTAGLKIVEAEDIFYASNADLKKSTDQSSIKQLIIDQISRELAKTPPAEWAKDLSTVPLYSPSYRQGYVRPTICVWNVCCPKNPDKCWIPDAMLVGVRRGLYYDVSISQAYNAALLELFVRSPLTQAIKEFKEISANNPLVRFAGSAGEAAVPSKIHEVLYNELNGGCLKYVPWSSWKYFTQWIDYLEPGIFLGDDKSCPNYKLQPELTKDPGASYPTANASWLLELFWNGWGDGGRIDEVEVVKYHLITVPEPMGQSIEDFQQFAYDVNDTLAELVSTDEFNHTLSNTVDDEEELLYSGKYAGPASARRRLAYYTCDDDMYSAQTETSIEDYVFGKRIGCFDTTEVPEGKCDGKLFGELIAGSSYEKSSAKGETYFNSYIKGNLTPELMNTYAQAEKETGVPCEILAGIHFVEAANNPEGSLVSGRKLGTPEPDAGGKVFRSLLETAKYAGDHLKGKVGGSISDAETAITALSRYNGGGNSNCQQGYPYPIPYGGCPRAFEGEDDPYPTSFVDPKHDSMYLLYCADHTACVPQIFERPGSFTVALNVYNSITKSGYENTELPEEQENPAPPPVVNPGGNSGSSGFFPESCGPESLATALGCLPYTREAFVSTLLSFIVGLSGGIALVLMLSATIQIMTAAADAKKLQSGRDLFFSALAGLLFLIFSVSLLRIIAGDIIKLPGFGG